jgi:hypothetical protein
MHPHLFPLLLLLPLEPSRIVGERLCVLDILLILLSPAIQIETNFIDPWVSFTCYPPFDITVSLLDTSQHAVLYLMQRFESEEGKNRLQPC